MSKTDMLKIAQSLRSTSFVSCTSFPSLRRHLPSDKNTSLRRSIHVYRHAIRLCSTSTETHAASTAVFDVPGKRVLLICRGKSPNYGQWAFPGGSVESGESLLDAAQRELTEETSMPRSSVSFIKTPVAVRRVPLQNGRGSVYVVHVFAAALSKASEPVAAGDAMDANFFSFDEISELECVDGLTPYIETAYKAVLDINNKA